MSEFTSPNTQRTRFDSRSRRKHFIRTSKKSFLLSSIQALISRHSFLKLRKETIAPAMKYVDLPSLVGGDPRAPRNRWQRVFAVFRLRTARGAVPTNTPRINIFHCRIYRHPASPLEFFLSHSLCHLRCERESNTTCSSQCHADQQWRLPVLRS